MERIVVQRHLLKANAPQLKRVAAYARVSSGKDAMLHSLSAQVSYYNDLIQSHSGWQYVGVYADEAMTGTMLGYRYEKGVLIIDPREAETVRRIYSEYLDGSGMEAIA